MLGNKETVAALANDLTEAGGVAALNVKGNFIFDAATHRDFLGALLGTGIEREKARGHIAPTFVEDLSCLWFLCMHFPRACKLDQGLVACRLRP